MSLLRCLRNPSAQLCGRTHLKAFHISAFGAAPSTSLEEIKFRPFEKLVPVPTKKPKQDPFVAGFFRGVIHEDFFTYPEVIGEDLKRIKDMTSVVQDFYKSCINKPEVQSQKNIPDNVINELKSLGLFALQVPRLYGGLELSAFELNSMAEVISQNASIFHLLNFHNLYGVNLLLEAGTEAQKQMFLPKLAAGDLLIAPCIWEKNAGSDLTSVETLATPLSSDSFLISGTKIWVNNADTAGAFLVLANVAKLGSRGDTDLTLFIVDKNSPGITIKRVERNCVEQLPMYEVSFNETVVKAENIIGEKGKGFELANKAILGRRTMLPSAVIQSVRSLLDRAVNHVIHREQFGQPLFNFNLIKWKLAEISTRLYVLESMAYMTAGLYDYYEDQDCVVESALTRVYAMETLQSCLSIFSDIFASRLLEKDFDLQCLKDAPFIYVCEGTKDVTKMQITLNCLRYVSEYEHERVSKLRNPLLFPQDRFKDYFRGIKQSKDKPDIKKLVSYNVHPSLMVPADALEYCIYRLQWTVDLNIVHSGTDITVNQHVMTGLADMALECYAMSAALARASRSYCIGLKNAEAEMMTAHLYVSQKVAKIRQLVELLNPHHPPVHFSTISGIAEAIGTSKGHFAEHPTERNYD